MLTTRAKKKLWLIVSSIILKYIQFQTSKVPFHLFRKYSLADGNKTNQWLVYIYDIQVKFNSNSTYMLVQKQHKLFYCQHINFKQLKA